MQVEPTPSCMVYSTDLTIGRQTPISWCCQNKHGGGAPNDRATRPASFYGGEWPPAPRSSRARVLPGLAPTASPKQAEGPAGGIGGGPRYFLSYRIGRTSECETGLEARFPSTPPDHLSFLPLPEREVSTIRIPVFFRHPPRITFLPEAAGERGFYLDNTRISAPYPPDHLSTSPPSFYGWRPPFSLSLIARRHLIEAA